jgi:hypothetical protein
LAAVPPLAGDESPPPPQPASKRTATATAAIGIGADLPGIAPLCKLSLLDNTSFFMIIIAFIKKRPSDTTAFRRVFRTDTALISL